MRESLVATNMGSTDFRLLDFLFDLNLTPAYVMIDRQTGSVVHGVVGRSEPDAPMPSCPEKD